MPTPVRRHVSALFRNDSSPVPWTRMILSGLATTLPLGAGFLRGQVTIAIYGALTGYLLMLNDHTGAIPKRLLNLTLTFFLLMSGFALGLLLRGDPAAFYVAIGIFTYWIGILGGEGAELERAALFATISLIISYFSGSLRWEAVESLFFYPLLAYGTGFLSILAIGWLRPRVPDPFLSLRDSLRVSWTASRHKHIHAVAYTLAALLAIALAQVFQIERGYWIAITVLLVMRVDRTLSLYVTGQRWIGTALGVLLFDFVAIFRPDAVPLILWVTICSFLIPYFFKRNYLYASLFVTAFVVSLLEIASLGGPQLGPHVAKVRLQATSIGCILSALGSLVSKILSLATQDRKKPGL